MNEVSAATEWVSGHGVGGARRNSEVRLKNGRKTPVLARHPDGSCLSMLGRLWVRVIDCEITVATQAGRHTGTYRLATTVFNHHRYPAGQHPR